MSTRDEVKAIVRAYHGGDEKSLDETVERIMGVFGRIIEEKGAELVSLGEIMQRKS